MKAPSKRAQAIALFAAGKAREEIRQSLQVSDQQLDRWHSDLGFVSAIEQKRQIMVREAQWSLMGFVPGAMLVFQRGTSNQKVSIAEKDITLNLYRSLGILTDDPIRPLPPGKVTVNIGTGKPKEKDEAPERTPGVSDADAAEGEEAGA